MTTKELKEQFGIEKPLSAIPYWNNLLNEGNPVLNYNESEVYNDYIKWLSTPLSEEILTEVFGFEIDKESYKKGYGYTFSKIDLYSPSNEPPYHFDGYECNNPVNTINDLLHSAEKESIQLELKK